MPGGEMDFSIIPPGCLSQKMRTLILVLLDDNMAGDTKHKLAPSMNSCQLQIHVSSEKIWSGSLTNKQQIKEEWVAMIEQRERERDRGRGVYGCSISLAFMACAGDWQRKNGPSIRPSVCTLSQQAGPTLRMERAQMKGV